MERNVPVAPVATAEQAPARELPARVQEALGELVGAAQDGLLALSVGVGLGVLAELMEEELDEVVGPKGKHDSERVAHRHGHEAGSVTLGGRRLPVSRPRARSADGEAESCRSPPTRTSPIAIRSPRSCSSGCWPASRRGALRAWASPSASGSSKRPVRRRSRRSRASSSRAPARPLGS